jgi:hypothetical protein
MSRRGSNAIVPRRGFRRRGYWWRPVVYFSKPLLANPTFRKLFLRTKEILETVYTEDVFFPRIQTLGERLKKKSASALEFTVKAPIRRWSI